MRLWEPFIIFIPIIGVGVAIATYPTSQPLLSNGPTAVLARPQMVPQNLDRTELVADIVKEILPVLNAQKAPEHKKEEKKQKHKKPDKPHAKKKIPQNLTQTKKQDDAYSLKLPPIEPADLSMDPLSQKTPAEMTFVYPRDQIYIRGDQPYTLWQGNDRPTLDTLKGISTQLQLDPLAPLSVHDGPIEDLGQRIAKNLADVEMFFIKDHIILRSTHKAFEAKGSFLSSLGEKNIRQTLVTVLSEIYRKDLPWDEEELEIAIFSDASKDEALNKRRTQNIRDFLLGRAIGPYPHKAKLRSMLSTTASPCNGVCILPKGEHHWEIQIRQKDISPLLGH